MNYENYYKESKKKKTICDCLWWIASLIGSAFYGVLYYLAYQMDPENFGNFLGGMIVVVAIGLFIAFIFLLVDWCKNLGH